MGRGLISAAVLLTIWGVAIAVSGGVEVVFLGLRISSRDPFRPCALAALLAACYAWMKRGTLPVSQRSEHGAVALCITVAVISAAFLRGSFVAGGSDSYGYISQANLWLTGSLEVVQPWAASLPWPDQDWIASPVGYRPGLAPHTSVPTYPIGFPILIAAFTVVGMPMLLVPLLAGLAVWLTYLIGREVSGDAVVGIVASVLLAASPIFLNQAMWVMADVPAAALWTLAFWWAVFRREPRPLLAGIASGIALMIRPNLLLLAFVPPITWIFFKNRPAANVGLFAAALAPWLAILGIVHSLLYGAPWVSGYGDLGGLFAIGNVWRNLRQYIAWTNDTQTILFLPTLLVGLIAARWVTIDQRLAAVCVLTCGGILLSYLFYQPFESWMYLRFLLPVWPLFCCTIASVLTRISRYSQSPVEAYALAVILLSPFAVTSLRTAVDLDVFEVGNLEQRFVVAARTVAEATPSNALVIADQHSGSVRFYGDRRTLRLPYIPGESFAEGIAQLGQRQPVFLFLEQSEERAFRDRGEYGAAYLDNSLTVLTIDEKLRLLKLTP